MMFTVIQLSANVKMDLLPFCKWQLTDEAAHVMKSQHNQL